jgi:hypothetical protein
MGRNKLNDHPKELKRPLEIMSNLHEALSEFLSNEMNIKLFKDDKLKELKDLRKSAAEFKDDLDTVKRDIESESHSIAAGTSRFAHDGSAKELVSKYLSSGKG